MVTAACRGIVKGGTVILEKNASLPEGAEVLVTPLGILPGSPQALLAAMKAPPHLTSKDVDEFERLIEAGKRPVADKKHIQRKRSRKKR